MKTTATKASEIKREWHLVDVKDQVLGRVSTQIAILLMGKDKPNWAPYLDGGDYVVVINAADLKVTGRKMKQKFYRRHSGYPGGFKEVRLDRQMAKNPTKVITHAVYGMLPKNKLRSQRLARLKVFSADKHSYTDKFKNSKE